jgi:putative ABC transport system permease protein
MIRNYFRIFARHFIRQKAYSFINVFGLSIGLASSIFIMMWVIDELSYNNFHHDGERIFQVMDNQTYSDGKTFTFEAVPGVLAEGLRAEVPEVQFAAHASWENSFLISVGDKSILENGFYAESDFFKIFSFRLIEGDQENAMPDKSSVAISQRTAKKYFGGEDPINKTIRVDNHLDLKVTAVFEDVPENSSIKCDIVIPYKIHFDNNSWLSSWSSNGIKCYVKLFDEKSLTATNEKIKLIAKTHNEKAVAEFWLQPFSRHRLYNVFKDGKEAGGRIEYVRIFSVVAVFVLLIACINFMNLATARAMNRAKEVGVRKVAGASRSALVKQFLAEAFAMTLMALIAALLMVQLLLPFFNEMIRKQLTMNLSDPNWIMTLSMVVILTSLFSGSYPAFLLSAFKPATVLKKLSLGNRTGTLRKALVVFQFSLSIILIIGAIVGFNQIKYLRAKNLGFNRDHVLFFWTPQTAFKNLNTYKHELLSFSGIKNVGISNQNPLQFGSSTGLDNWPGKEESQSILFNNSNIDETLIPTLEMHMVEGRNFNGNPADSASIIFNEEAIRQMGLSLPAVGQIVTYGTQPLTIIGIVQDFHSTNLKYALSPVFFTYGVNWGNTLLRVEPDQTTAAIAHAEEIYKKYNPGYPFSSDFLDQFFERQYTSDKIIGQLAFSFTVVAIIISLLGLYSLASFTAEQRIKEMGIRKALGASVSQLVLMLCTSFSKLVAMALIIGCPVAYYLMNNFLEGYAFHTPLSASFFVFTALAILLISMATVMYQSIKAASVNPSENLRTE